MITLQLFSEDAVENQTSNQLRKGIRTFQKRIEQHKEKIASPKKFYPNYDSWTDRERIGNSLHWHKEIKNFEESIQNRIDELKKRGEDYE